MVGVEVEVGDVKVEAVRDDAAGRAGGEEGRRARGGQTVRGGEVLADCLEVGGLRFGVAVLDLFGYPVVVVEET